MILQKRTWVLCAVLAIVAGCKSSQQPGELVMDAAKPTLENATWEMITLNGKPAGRLVTILLQDGKVTAWAGCNKIGGTYSTKGKSLTLSLTATKIVCPDQVNVETPFLDTMARVTGYAIKNGELSLKQGSTTVATLKKMEIHTY